MILDQNDKDSEMGFDKNDEEEKGMDYDYDDEMTPSEME